MPILIVALVTFGLAVLIRWLAHRQILWMFIPENTFVFITTRKEETGDMTQGGAGVVKILHNVPGKKLTRRGDITQWRFVKGREWRSLLYYLLGVSWIGLFRYVRTNRISRLRVSKIAEKAGESQKVGSEKEKVISGKFRDYDLVFETLVTKYVPFSGEIAFSVNDVETQSVFPLNFLFNLLEENEVPWKSVLRVADPHSFGAGVIKQEVNSIVGVEKAEYFLKQSPESTAALLQAAERSRKEIMDQLGKKLVEFNLIATDMDEDNRTLFELETKTQMEQAAALTAAVSQAEQAIEAKRGEAEGIKLVTEALAERVQKVTIPAAANENTVKVRYAEALENNKTLTNLTYAPGRDPVVALSE